MTDIISIGNAGGGDLNRRKTPEERQAEIEALKAQWDRIQRDIEAQASATHEETRARVNLPHQGRELDIDA